MTTGPVKFLKEDADSFYVGGYGVVWGGKDTDGEHFDSSCDFWFDRLTQTPMVLYNHGRDRKIKSAVLGKVLSHKSDDIGMWIEAQIKDHEKYSAAIKDLIAKGVLGWSSGSISHLTEKTSTGKITSWPVGEWSLTNMPAEPRTLGVRELVALSELEPTLKSVLPADLEDRLAAETKTDPPDAPADPPAPKPPTAKVADSDTGESSFEDLIEELTTAINGGMFGQSVPWLPATGYARIIATYPDHALVRYTSYEGPSSDAEQFYHVAYTIDDDKVRLGDVTPMEQTYIEKKSAKSDDRFKTAPLQISHDSAIKFAQVALARTKDVSERRVSEGRKLSEGHRAAIVALLGATKANACALEDLLTAIDPPAKADADRLRVLELRSRQHLMHKET